MIAKNIGQKLRWDYCIVAGLSRSLVYMFGLSMRPFLCFTAEKRHRPRPFLGCTAEKRRRPRPFFCFTAEMRVYSWVARRLSGKPSRLTQPMFWGQNLIFMGVCGTVVFSMRDLFEG